jgi:hypothetical protein
VTAVDGWPPSVAADLCEGSGIAGEEVFGSLLIRWSHIAQGMNADLKGIRSVTCTAAGLPVENPPADESGAAPHR